MCIALFVLYEPAKSSAYDVRRVGWHLDEPEERMVFHAALVQMFARRPRGRLESVSVFVVLSGGGLKRQKKKRKKKVK